MWNIFASWVLILKKLCGNYNKITLPCKGARKNCIAQHVVWVEVPGPHLEMLNE